MNSVGMGSDEIYFCMPFKTLNSVALEMELEKKSMAGNSVEARGVEILGSSSLSSSRG